MSNTVSDDEIDRWLDAPASGPVLHVTGFSVPQARQCLLCRAPVLTAEAPTGGFEEAMHGFRGYVETLIDRFIRMEHLNVSADLQHLLDQGLYNPELGELFEDLWTARFEYREKRRFDSIVQQLVTVTCDRGAPGSRSDALLFWLTLMGQNYDVTPGKVNLVVGSTPDPDLAVFLTMTEAWQGHGCPLRVLVLS